MRGGMRWRGGVLHDNVSLEGVTHINLWPSQPSVKFTVRRGGISLGVRRMYFSVRAVWWLYVVAVCVCVRAWWRRGFCPCSMYR